LAFFKVRFWAFLGKGSSKTRIQMFWQEVRVEIFSQNFGQNFDVSFSSASGVLRVFGCFSAMGVQKHYKKRFTKKVVSKGFYKKIDQRSKTDFFSDLFFLSTILGVSRQGEFKNTIQIFWQKVRVEIFSQNFDQNFDVSFSSASVVLRIFGCFSAMGVQKHYKKRFTKKVVSKGFYKKIDKKSKTDFFSNLFITFLGVSR
jgi:hypothetical protein